MTNALLHLVSADASTLSEATGLVSGTDLDDLGEAGLVVDRSTTGKGRLGTDRLAARWVSVESDVYEGGLLAWLRDDIVVMLEGSYPIDAHDEPAVVQQLDEPERRLDTYLGRVLLKSAEHVYPEQGLTIRVNPENSMLLSIYCYVPTSGDQYERLLRPDPKRGVRP
jgi:hypothetical protein